jgi:GNAT superfamily N-acetyltransferase
MDSQLGYGMSARQAAALPLSAREGAELGGAQDTEALCQIASVVFEGFGHYFANPRLDRDRCREIYVDWTRRTLSDTEFADKAFVYRDQGKPVALFCAKMVGAGEGRYVRGGMGFVAPPFQREGVFKRLVSAAVCWAGEEGVGLDKNLVHSTNYPVNAVFTRIGFKLTSHWMTFHRWLG